MLFLLHKATENLFIFIYTIILALVMKQILTLAFLIVKLELTHYTPALLDTSQLK